MGNLPELPSHYVQTDTIAGQSSLTLSVNIPHPQGTMVTLPRIPSGHLKMSFQMTHTHSSSSSLNYANGFTCAKSLQLCPTRCDPTDCSLPSSSVQGILQARILEWIAIPFSRGSSFPTQGLNLDFLHCRQILYHLSQQESPRTQQEISK